MIKVFHIISATICILIFSLVITTFATDGTYQIFGDEEWSCAFDSLGQSLLEGRVDVEPSTISWEGVKSGDKVVLYFSPFPAFLRIIFNYLRPSNKCLWARLSCLIACIFSCFMAALILNTGGFKENFNSFIAYFIVSGLSTPIFFLVSTPSIYNEAIIWALAFSLASVYYLTKITETESKIKNRYSMFMWFFFVSLTLLSRLTFALPHLLLTPVVFFIFHGNSYSIDGEARKIKNLLKNIFSYTFVASPIIISFLICCWYNHERHGSYLYFSKNVDYIDFDALGGMFNLRRLLASAYYYFIPTLGNIISFPPYLTMRHALPWPKEIFLEWQEHTSTIFLSSFWLVLIIVINIKKIFRLNFIQYSIIAAFFVQVIFICSFVMISERYSAEILPFLFVMAHILRNKNNHLNLKFFLLFACSCLICFLQVVSWHIFIAGMPNRPIHWSGKLSRFLQKNGNFYSIKPDSRIIMLDKVMHREFFEKNSTILSDLNNRYLDDNTFPYGIYFSPGDKINLLNEKESYLMTYAGIPEKFRVCVENSFKLTFSDLNNKTSLEYRIDKYSPHNEVKFLCKSCEIKMEYLDSTKANSECGIVFLGGLREQLEQQGELLQESAVENIDLTSLTPIEAFVSSPHKVEPYYIEKRHSPRRNKENVILKMPSSSRLKYLLPKNSIRFQAKLNNAYESRFSKLASSRVSILDDESRLLYYSDIITPKTGTMNIDIIVKDLESFTINVDPADNSYDGDWVEISESRIVKLR